LPCCSRTPLSLPKRSQARSRRPHVSARTRLPEVFTTCHIRALELTVPGASLPAIDFPGLTFSGTMHAFRGRTSLASMTEDSNRDPWSEYRRRRLWVRLVLPLVLCAVVAGAVWSSVMTAVIGVVSALALLAALQHVEAWLCPRCGRTFFRRGRRHNSFSKGCMNCALPKWMHPDDMSNTDDAPLPNRATWV
jgi:hypothetical protein